MKKIMFIIILATTLIPISQTGASMSDSSVSYKAKEVQTAVKNKSLLTPEIIEQKADVKNNSRSKARLSKKRISNEKRDRLFGLLLLAHGGQR